MGAPERDSTGTKILPELNVAEVGFLTGSGLSTWSDLLPRIFTNVEKLHLYGFDYDPNNFRANFRNLYMALGAFREREQQHRGRLKQLSVEPRVFVFDQGNESGVNQATLAAALSA